MSNKSHLSQHPEMLFRPIRPFEDEDDDEDENDYSDYWTEGLAFGCGNGELTGDGLAVSLAFDSSSLLASF